MTGGIVAAGTTAARLAGLAAAAAAALKETAVVAIFFAVAVESNEWEDPAEVRRIEQQVAHAVVGEVGVRPRNVVVLGPGTIPKTPSGKLRRANSIALVS